MGFFTFLKKRKFYLHLIVAVGVSVLLLFGVLKSLDVFTRHGNVYLVPNFEGQTLDGLIDNHFEEYFTFKVIDSLYDPSKTKGSIVLQNPKSGAKVKKGRHVYLTTVALLPEKVTMPNLLHLSLRQALVTLQSAGLEVEELNYVPYFARNAVVDQLINGEPIEADTEIEKGSPIELVLGKGESLNKVALPMLIGLTKEQARSLIHYNSLNVGKEYFQEAFQPVHSRVYKTDPPALSEGLLDLGAKINLWYRSDEFFDFEEYTKQFKVDSLKSDTIVINRYLIENE